MHCTLLSLGILGCLMREKHVLKSFVGWNPTSAWSRDLYLPFFEGLTNKNRDLWLKAEVSIYKPCDPLQELCELLTHASTTNFSSGTNFRCSQYHSYTILGEPVWVQKLANILLKIFAQATIYWNWLKYNIENKIIHLEHGLPVLYIHSSIFWGQQ